MGLLDVLPALAELLRLFLGEDPKRHLHLAPPEVDVEPVLADLDAARDVEVEAPEAPARGAELHLVEGQLDLGPDGVFDDGQLLVLKPGRDIAIAAVGSARCVLLGGEAMESPRYLSWNFVSSSAERIEQAKQDWRDQNFPKVPGETESIPLPDIPGKPVRYP